MKTMTLTALAVTVTMLGCHAARQSPSDALRAAYLAANDGRYAEAQEYLSPDVVATIERDWAQHGGMKGAWDAETRNGAIERIEILKEDVHGDQAMLSFRLHFKDGSSKDDLGPLIKRDGVWKIAPAK